MIKYAIIHEYTLHTIIISHYYYHYFIIYFKKQLSILFMILSHFSLLFLIFPSRKIQNQSCNLFLNQNLIYWRDPIKSTVYHQWKPIHHQTALHRSPQNQYFNKLSVFNQKILKLCWKRIKNCRNPQNHSNPSKKNSII